MKKTIISLLLLAVPFCLYAQLEVSSNGSVRMASDMDNYSAKYMLHVGDTVDFESATDYGIISSIKDKVSYRGVGVKGSVKLGSQYPYSRIGVWGEAGFGSNYCYGVVGQLTGYSNGSGVYGMVGEEFLPAFVNGQYAGLFNGDTRVVGDLTATNVYTTSDIRLKNNVSDILEGESSNTLDKLMDVNVIKYNLKEEAFGTDGSEKSEKLDNATSLLHFGVSAQELQEIYPNLVKEGQDGYLAVNYTELVPVLIRSIQELKHELDAVKGNDESRMTRAAAFADTEMQPSTKNVLYQNTPNPFKEQTVIRFSLADEVQYAAICIFDLTGKMLKRLPVSPGATCVSVNGWELGEGMFLYSLLVNGCEIDSKRMIIMN